MTAPAAAEVLEALGELTRAFAERDAGALLDRCTDDVTYVGSEDGERATGRADVGALLGRVLGRPEAYVFTWSPPLVGIDGDVAWILAEGVSAVHDHDPLPGQGATEAFPYRLSAVLRRVGGGWRWVLIHGAEPTPPAGEAA